MLKLGLLALIVTSLAIPADAADMNGPPTVEVEHFAPLPCSVACAYWDAPGAAGYNECARPFPEGSYDESTFRLTSQSGFVHIEAQSVNDYDSFICTDTEPRVLVAPVGGRCCDPCNGIAGNNAVAWGCLESGGVTFNGLAESNGGANDRFVIISYNWSDTEPLPVKLWGPVELIHDSFEANISGNLP